MNFGLPVICQKSLNIQNTDILFLLLKKPKKLAIAVVIKLKTIEDILEMVGIGSGAERAIENIKLSRYACYLIVQNADPSTEVVALGQTYFAVQTRFQEIRQMDEYNRLSTEDEKRIFLRNEIIKHNSLLAAAAKNAGVAG